MGSENDLREPLRLGPIVRVVKRRLPLVVICALIGGAVAYAMTRQATRKFTATAAIYFQNDQLGLQIAGLSPSVDTDAATVQQTNVNLVQLGGNVPRRVAAELGHGLTGRAVRAMAAIAGVNNTTIVNVAMTAESPRLAAALANSYASLFVKSQASQTVGLYRTALRDVNEQLAELSPSARAGQQGITLEERAQTLETLEQIRPDVSVAQQAAVPSMPSSPRVIRDVALAATLALLIGLAAAAGLERLDQRVREPGELEEAYGFPLLGIIPISSHLPKSPRRRLWPRASSPARMLLRGASQISTGEPRIREAFQQIRAKMRYFNIDEAMQVVMITSASPGDGKTTLAYNLAEAASRVGSRTLIIDADLHAPRLRRVLGLVGGAGLVDVLSGGASLEQAAKNVPDGFPGMIAIEDGGLWVIGEESAAPNPMGIVDSTAMQSFLKHCRTRFDLVVIDTPPLAPVPDAMALVPHVDGVLLIGRLGVARRPAVKQVAQSLRRAEAPVLGVVANGATKSVAGEYAYGYEYVGLA